MADLTVGADWRELQPHPAAEIFPPLDQDSFEKLKADIQVHGLLRPIELLEGQVLDGRHRLRACRELGMQPDLKEIECDDPVAHVVSLNLVRRHLTTPQLGMCAARAVRVREELEADAAARMKRGRKDPRPPGDEGDANAGRTTAKLGEMFSVSRNTVERATRVEERGAADLVRAVERGEIPLATAAKLAVLPKPEQKAALKGGKDAIKEAVASAPKAVKPLHVVVRAAFESVLKTLENLELGVGDPSTVLKSGDWRKEQNKALAHMAQRAQHEFAKWQAALTQPASQLSLVAQAAHYSAAAASVDEEELEEEQLMEDEDAS